MLTIVDYGVGNLRNVYMAFRRIGVEAEVTGEAAGIRRASAIVLPGVGAFGDAIANIRALGLEATLVDAIRDGMPFMGICLGLQLLFEVSEEMGEHRGLGILEGRVRRFPPGLAVPHMGWNQIRQVRAVPLWRTPTLSTPTMSILATRAWSPGRRTMAPSFAVPWRRATCTASSSTRRRARTWAGPSYRTSSGKRG